MLRSRFTCLLVGIALSSLALTGPTPARAAEGDERKNEFGFLVGLAFGDELLVTDDKEDRANPMIGLRYGHLFNRSLGYSIDATYVPEYVSSLPAGDASEVAARVALDWYFWHGAKTRWFLSPGVGWADYGLENADGFDRGFVSLAIGQKWSLGCAPQSFSWQVRDDYTVVGDDGVGGEDLNSIKALLGWNWGLGKPSDDDGDGVPSCADQCPGTPAGAKVDKKGCPTDSDGDGVFDGIDRCPDTPKGAPVDAQGCPLDSDGDGVIDLTDACPNTPKGAIVDARGCPKDSDGDGVWDGIDKCPDTQRGCTVDATGCPKDSDGDGVCDGLDRCPDTPRGTKVDASGCPIPEAPKAAPLFQPGKKNLVLEGVNFEYDKAILTADSTEVLDRVVASLKEWSDVRVEIAGFTDSRGPDAYNQKLSERRAEAVRTFFVERGIDPSRLTAKGYGEARPIADNKTDEGRAQNRRVELEKQD